MKKLFVLLATAIFLVVGWTGTVNAEMKVKYRKGDFGEKEGFAIFGEYTSTSKYSYMLISDFLPRGLDDTTSPITEYSIVGDIRSKSWLWIHKAVLKDGTELQFNRSNIYSRAETYRSEVLCHERYRISFSRDLIDKYTQKNLVFMIKGNKGNRIITVPFSSIKEWLDKVDEVKANPQAFMVP